MSKAFRVQGKLVDIENREVYPVEIQVSEGKINRIDRIDSSPDQYILPGFIDAHVHIESSLLIPTEFARLASIHGTVATVSDPHEIANVCGLKGVEYMVENGNQSPFKFFFGAPSCVPATQFETAGSTIDSTDIAKLLKRDDIYYLAEMMNWPGVLSGDEEVLKKIELAKKFGKPVDGHAPALTGDEAARYINAGITTDHECVALEEARFKALQGMKIAIREGSAAKNFDALIDLIDEFPDQIMFCSDDKHPDSLLLGHINQLVARAIDKGKDLFAVLKACCITPIQHYNLAVGRLKPNEPADFIVVKDLINFNVLETYISGILVAKEGESKILSTKTEPINNFNVNPLSANDFELNHEGGQAKVIVVEDSQLITGKIFSDVPEKDGKVIVDIEKDILKIAILNRYLPDVKPSVALVKNFGLKNGAIASSVAHDSHNIIVVGTSDVLMAEATNLIIQEKGGLSAVRPTGNKVLNLPVAGLMSNSDGFLVASSYIEVDKKAKELGSGLQSPFMTLSFMGLLVIPHLKLSDKGLFDSDLFKFEKVFG
ncbi:adenine deaminase [Cyclobacterium marinum]|uniref:Adenine deaminase n=1 Tax=Cyclobacterium marinum (strain ATCC 25205 / DSM 745 / LMG 13164 / NCIMB 1802) TaxID=880070 RepID=G0IZT3_CYCMS|nr:adenine deaminase [Cyclobacterium marinum]AEL25747.1 Adenine deaminase [Cyclobacterium marinum DSM 745]